MDMDSEEMNLILKLVTKYEGEMESQVKILELHANALKKLINENEMMKEQLTELYKDRVKDKLVMKATIISIINTLSSKRIMDIPQFLNLFKNQIIEDKDIFEELDIDINEILKGAELKPAPVPQTKPKTTKKPKVKVKDGIIDFKDYKNGC